MAGRTHTEEDSVVTEPNGRGGYKTLGIRLPDELHAQFSLVANLDNMSLGDAAVRAVEQYVATKRQADDFAARAQAALDEIEREAAARRNAIQGLFGKDGQEVPASLNKARAKRHPSGQSE
jgi:predicted transcriptional regulator